MDEEWRDIAGYEGLYQVSNLGRVRSSHASKVKKGQSNCILDGGINRDGYVLVTLFRPGDKQRQAKVHRLVFQAFIGPIPGNSRIKHKNGDRADNRAENLEYYTTTVDQVREVRRLHLEGYSLRQIAEKLGAATGTTIWRIIHGKTWRDIRPPE